MFIFLFNIFLLNEIGLYGLPGQILIILLILLLSLILFFYIKTGRKKESVLNTEEDTQNNFLKSILDHSSTGNAILDSEGFIRYVNFGFEALVSNEQIPLEGKNISDIPRLQKLNRSFSEKSSSVVNVLGSDGETYMIKYFTVKNSNGEIIGRYLKMLPDVLSKEEPADVDLSHELKTPLHAVLGFTDLLKKDSELTSDQEKLLEKIIYHSKVLDNKIKNLVGSEELKPDKPSEITDVQSVKKILVVDDVSINRTLLKLMLKRHGLDVEEASNGQAALKILENWKADMILMDLSMPVLDGIETVRIIRSEGLISDSKIFAVTATQRYSRDELRDLGFDDLMQKPFKEEELLDLLGFQRDTQSAD